MRFSYIDSQDKEIEVDSVESLALRIQLGAIKPDTRMYDAVADRWAPAEEHPVYRALSRGEEVDEEEVVALARDVAAETEEGEEEERKALEGAEEVEAEELEAEELEAEAEGADRRQGTEAPEAPGDATSDREVSAEIAPGGDDPLGLGFQVSVTDEGGEGEDGGRADAPSDRAEESDLSPAGEPEVKKGVREPPPAPTLERGPSGAGESRETEDEAETGMEDVGEPPPDRTTEVEEHPTTPEADSPPSWLDEGEALWDVEEDASDRDRGGSDEADGKSHRDALEEDLADPRRRMPEWATGPVDVDEWADLEEESATRPPPQSTSKREDRKLESPAGRRPAHWDERRRARARRSRFVRPAQVGGLVLLVGAVAGYFLLTPGDAVEQDVPEEEEVAEPLLPPDQWAALATAADRAWSDVLEEFRAAIPGYGLPYRPPTAWLDGIYLSSASDYPGVVDYWNGVVETVEALRARESALYFQYLNQHLERMVAGSGQIAGAGASVPAEAVGRIVSVARTEYEGTATVRDSAYQELRDLASASLDLHDLLVEREEDILYEPFTDPQVSRDPVLEAVPADSVLRSQMNAALDRVIAAITENGIPRPITTSALFNHLLTELGRTETASETPPPPEPRES